MKILIAEDEPDILAQYKIALERRKHQLVTTVNGEECIRTFMAELEQSKGRPFDVAVLDYRMP